MLFYHCLLSQYLHYSALPHALPANYPTGTDMDIILPPVKNGK